MARKNLLIGLSDINPAVRDEGAAAKAVREPSLGFTGRGAFGSVTKTIDDLAARANLATDLEARIAAGDLVVELEPAAVDASFIIDRMRDQDDSYALVLEGIKAQGQSSPILVRPHPKENGRYQVAFGHRRLRAARELGRPVRAVVKHLSDRDLVVAQGQENSARADLSFIERARFALHLEEAGYDRETIMSALSVDKTTVSRYISVASQIAAAVIDMIGPAHGRGRDRWLELSTLFQGSGKDRIFDKLFQEPAFRAASSDGRFDAVAELLRSLPNRFPSQAELLPSRKQRSYWSTGDGLKVANVRSTDRSFVLTIDRRVAPNFGEYLLDEMGRLYEAYSRKRTG
jgi:ParB family transcriptional regulator, chromosome partitioning protein